MQAETPNIAIVITTYKRIELLRVLLDSIQQLQTSPAGIVLVDNENSPEVCQLSREYGIEHYIGMEENTGGAGGFSRGICEAYKAGYDWFWVMDDDVKVLPDALDRLLKWMRQTEEMLAEGKSLEEVPTVYQGLRFNFDGTFFYWQYHFMPRLGIPNPIAPSSFKDGETYRPMNTVCFEGGLFHRSIVERIGLPDARFFIYWDDTIFGYLASKHTKLLLVTDYILQRTRTLDNVKVGKVRKLNSTSDLSRYHIMRNRGHMAHYLQENGDYNPVVFSIGTGLTFMKEVIRLFVNDSVKTGFPKIIQGMKDAKKIRKDKTWRPYSAIAPIENKPCE